MDKVDLDEELYPDLPQNAGGEQPNGMQGQSEGERKEEIMQDQQPE